MSNKSKSKKSLDDLLNIPDVEIVPNVDNDLPVQYEAMPVETVKSEIQNKENIKDDYNLARNTLRSLIVDGQAALKKVLDSENESPRVVEVTAGLIKNIAGVAKDLLDLQKTKQDIDNPKRPISNNSQEKPAEITNNTTVYLTSTSDLNKLMDESEEEKKGDD